MHTSLLRLATAALLFIAAALLFAGLAKAGEAQPQVPRRVMSLNMCPDQLLLALLPPERITSVTYISRYNASPELRARAAKVGVNYGTAEEVFAQHPDLVFTGEFSTAATRAVLKRVGYPYYAVPSADTFQEIREQTLTIGRLVGAGERAEQLVAAMDAMLAELTRTAPKRPIRVVAWDGSGSVPGRDTLFNEILTVAGGVNLAAAAPDALLNSFDIEQLLFAHPDLIAHGEHDLDEPSLSHEPLNHQAVRKRYAHRQITYPEHLYTCGLPESADAARRLRDTMLTALAAAAHE